MDTGKLLSSSCFVLFLLSVIVALFIDFLQISHFHFVWVLGDYKGWWCQYVCCRKSFGDISECLMLLGGGVLLICLRYILPSPPLEPICHFGELDAALDTLASSLDLHFEICLPFDSLWRFFPWEQIQSWDTNWTLLNASRTLYRLVKIYFWEVLCSFESMLLVLEQNVRVHPSYYLLLCIHLPLCSGLPLLFWLPGNDL